VDSGSAYYCTCSPEKLEKMRADAMAAGENPKYDGTCRHLNLGPVDGAVVRLAAPPVGTTALPDAVKGPIVFQNTELDDFIICRSDGMPTYNLAVVVDDITMGVNTIIRGDDHVSNTPKQILIYKALGAELPTFAHVPMVLGNDRTRLSKRHGATSVTAYRDMGVLPEAMLNYMVRLGWSYGDQEFFTRDELIEKFTLENIGKSAGVFDLEKLLALNADHIMASAPEHLFDTLLPLLEARDCPARSGDWLAKVVETLKPRSKTLVEMADQAVFYFKDDFEYEEKPAKKFLKANALEPVQLLAARLEALEDFSEPSLEAVFQAVMDETGLKLGKIAQPVRVALTGRSASPGIFEIVALIGKPSVLKRLQRAVGFIEKRIAASG
jgi:glutamyl-tRNA synthetase